MGGAVAGALTAGAAAPAVAAAMQSKTAKIAELQQEVHILKEVAAKDSNTISSLSDQLSNLRIQEVYDNNLIVKLRSRIDILLEQRGQLRLDNQTLTNSLQISKKQVLQLKENLEACEAKVQELMQYLQVSKDTLNGLYKGVAQESQLANLLREGIQKETQQIATMAQRLNELQQTQSNLCSLRVSVQQINVQIVEHLEQVTQVDTQNCSEEVEKIAELVAAIKQGLDAVKDSTIEDAISAIPEPPSPGAEMYAYVDWMSNATDTITEGIQTALDTLAERYTSLMAKAAQKVALALTERGSIFSDVSLYSSYFTDAANHISPGSELHNELVQVMVKVITKSLQSADSGQDTIKYLLKDSLQRSSQELLHNLANQDEFLTAAAERLEELISSSPSSLQTGSLAAITLTANGCMAASSVTECVAAAANVVVPSTQLTAVNVLSAVGAATLSAFKLFAAIL